MNEWNISLTSTSLLSCSSCASSSSFLSRRACPTSAARMRSFSSMVELLSWSVWDPSRLFVLTPWPMMRCREIGVDDEKGKNESSRLGEVTLSFLVESILVDFKLGCFFFLSMVRTTSSAVSETWGLHCGFGTWQVKTLKRNQPNNNDLNSQTYKSFWFSALILSFRFYSVTQNTWGKKKIPRVCLLS